jgi:plasmid stability protein
MTKNSQEDFMTEITIQLDDELCEQVRAYATKRGLSMEDAIIELIKKGLEEVENEAGNN